MFLIHVCECNRGAWALALEAGSFAFRLGESGYAPGRWGCSSTSNALIQQWTYFSDGAFVYFWSDIRIVMVFVGFEVLTAVVMKSAVFCDIVPCSPFEVNQRLGWIYCLHPQGRRITRARKQRESSCLCLPSTFRLDSCSAYSSTLKMEAICSS
jgi:hypothetical protein